MTLNKLMTLGICILALGLGACSDNTDRDSNPATLPDQDPATTPNQNPGVAPAQDPANIPAN